MLCVSVCCDHPRILLRTMVRNFRAFGEKMDPVGKLESKGKFQRHQALKSIPDMPSTFSMLLSPLYMTVDGHVACPKGLALIHS